LIAVQHPTGRPNFTRVTLGATRFYFSYETLIGVENLDGLVVCQNVWSKTTAKHCNYLQSPQYHVAPGAFRLYVEPIIQRLSPC
jgi:hypothetical protein